MEIGAENWNIWYYSKHRAIGLPENCVIFSRFEVFSVNALPNSPCNLNTCSRVQYIVSYKLLKRNDSVAENLVLLRWRLMIRGSIRDQEMFLNRPELGGLTKVYIFTGGQEWTNHSSPCSRNEKQPTPPFPARRVPDRTERLADRHAGLCRSYCISAGLRGRSENSEGIGRQGGELPGGGHKRRRPSGP